MLEYCPRGGEKPELFACFFLWYLPQKLRIQGIHEALRDLKTVATMLTNSTYIKRVE
jgi:hypothetical protein